MLVARFKPWLIVFWAMAMGLVLVWALITGKAISSYLLLVFITQTAISSWLAVSASRNQTPHRTRNSILGL